jgi:glycosyltransferase involved in cell wall biosynthesis
MMRALVVAPQPFFSPRGTPFSVYYRTRTTAEQGVSIDLLTYGEGNDVDIPGVTTYRIPRFSFLGPTPVGPSLKKAWLDLFIILWTVWLLLRNRYDLVHAHEESIFFLRWLKPIFGFKLVYDMHSCLPQQLTNFRFTESRALIRLFEMLEDSSLAHSDAVITICPDLERYALSRMPDPSRHFLIENSLFDPVRLKGTNGHHGNGNGNGVRPAQGARPAVPATLVEELPADRPIVGYAGTFEHYQGVDLLIRAFAAARRTVPELFLLLVGGDPEQVEEQRGLVRSLGIERHVRFTGRVEQSTAKTLMARAAVLTSPRTDGTNTPLKIYEQLASGVPLVATRILSHTQVLDDSVCVLVDPEPASMAQGLIRALDETVRREVTTGARALYDRQYSPTAYERKIRQLLAVLS